MFMNKSIYSRTVYFIFEWLLLYGATESACGLMPITPVSPPSLGDLHPPMTRTVWLMVTVPLQKLPIFLILLFLQLCLDLVKPRPQAFGTHLAAGIVLKRNISQSKVALNQPANFVA